jgi:hypothetical protein
MFTRSVPGNSGFHARHLARLAILRVSKQTRSFEKRKWWMITPARRRRCVILAGRAQVQVSTSEACENS